MGGHELALGPGAGPEILIPVPILLLLVRMDRSTCASLGLSFPFCKRRHRTWSFCPLVKVCRASLPWLGHQDGSSEVTVKWQVKCTLQKKQRCPGSEPRLETGCNISL